MNRHASSFRVAFTALLLAIGLPLLLLCAANVRQRQLQSRANPRWATFAKATGSQEPAVNAESTFDKRPEKAGGSNRVPARLASHTKDLTGSVTGSSHVDMPIASTADNTDSHSQAIEPSSRPPANKRQLTAMNTSANVPYPDDDPVREGTPRREVVEVESRPEIKFHTVKVEPPRDSLRAEQLESQIAGIQRRLDQLAQLQTDNQVSDFDRAAKLLKQLQQAQAAAAGQIVPPPPPAQPPIPAPDDGSDQPVDDKTPSRNSASSDGNSKARRNDQDHSG